MAGGGKSQGAPPLYGNEANPCPHSVRLHNAESCLLRTSCTNHRNVAICVLQMSDLVDQAIQFKRWCWYSLSFTCWKFSARENSQEAILVNRNTVSIVSVDFHTHVLHTRIGRQGMCMTTEERVITVHTHQWKIITTGK